MLKRAFVVLVLIQMIACGGGGGGGGSSRPSTGVRLLHAGIDLSPLEVVSSSSQAPLTSAKFADASAYAALDTKSQIIALRRANTSEVIEQLNFDVKAGELRTIIIAGSRSENGGVQARANLDSIPELDGSSAAVRIAHGAFGAATVDASINGNAIGHPVGFTSTSGYNIVPAGAVSVSVVRSVDSSQLYSGTFSAAPGGAYTIFVAGEVGYYIKSSVLTD